MESNLIGRTILGYDVVSRLGAGAYGSVYKVVKENPIGTYTRVLKHIVLPSEKNYYEILNQMNGNIEATNKYFEERFNEVITEVRILNDFTENNVPNVVRYYENDVEISDNPRQYNLYILMEYLTPIQNFLAKHPFTVNDVIILGLDILYGLNASHESGVIHRDVKLDNIFYSNNEFKIGDFGVSKILDDSTRALSLKGSPDYLAPEVYLGKEGYDKTVDLYSLGIVLYRLLNYNRNPFLPPYPEAFTPEDEDIAFSKRMTGEKPELPALATPELGEVIVKAISGPEERYKSAKEFYDALEAAANNLTEEELKKEVNGTNIYYSNEEYLNSLNTHNSDVDNLETIKSSSNPEYEETRRTSNTVKIESPPPEPEPQPVYAAPVEPAEPPYRVVKGPSRLRKILPWLCILLAVLIGALGFLIARNNQEEEAAPTTSTTVNQSPGATSNSSNSTTQSDEVVSPNATYYTAESDSEPIFATGVTDHLMATATSQRYPINGFTYNPEYVIDKNLDTAWVEGKEGDGAGESIQLTYSGSPETVSSITFVLGYAKNSETYYGNSIPLTLEMSVDGKHYCDIKLKDTMSPQVAYIDKFTLKDGSTVTFTLEDTQLGPDDPTFSVAITEIAFN